MSYDVLSIAAHGFLSLPWWGYILVTLALTHITIASVTIFLHRSQAHRGLDLHPAVAHFFRFWLWLTTGMVTKEWVAIHRKHHAKVETDEDPHSPQTRGIRTVLLRGAELYRDEAKNREDRKSTRLNSSHPSISYAVFCLKKKTKTDKRGRSDSD